MPSIVVIGSKDDFAHVYPDKQEALADRWSRGGGDGDLQFFDSKGKRFDAKYDQTGKLVDLKPAAGGHVTAEALHGRLTLVLEDLREFIAANTALMAVYGFTTQRALAEVATSAQPFENWVVGTDLGPTLGVFAGNGGPTGGRGSFIHNWLHH